MIKQLMSSTYLVYAKSDTFPTFLKFEFNTTFPLNIYFIIAQDHLSWSGFT